MRFRIADTRRGIHTDRDEVVNWQKAEFAQIHASEVGVADESAARGRANALIGRGYFLSDLSHFSVLTSLILT